MLRVFSATALLLLLGAQHASASTAEADAAQDDWTPFQALGADLGCSACQISSGRAQVVMEKLASRGRNYKGKYTFFEGLTEACEQLPQHAIRTDPETGRRRFEQVPAGGLEDAEADEGLEVSSRAQGHLKRACAFFGDVGDAKHTPFTARMKGAVTRSDLNVEGLMCYRHMGKPGICDGVYPSATQEDVDFCSACGVVMEELHGLVERDMKEHIAATGVVRFDLDAELAEVCREVAKYDRHLDGRVLEACRELHAPGAMEHISKYFEQQFYHDSHFDRQTNVCGQFRTQCKQVFNRFHAQKLGNSCGDCQHLARDLHDYMRRSAPSRADYWGATHVWEVLEDLCLRIGDRHPAALRSRLHNMCDDLLADHEEEVVAMMLAHGQKHPEDYYAFEEGMCSEVLSVCAA